MSTRGLSRNELRALARRHRRGPGPEQHVHRLVAETAKGIMHEIYDQFMQDNEGYAEWKRLHPEMNASQLAAEYVRTRWGLAIPAARGALAQMLTTGVDIAVKDQIMEALVLDAGLQRGRQPGWLRDRVVDVALGLEPGTSGMQMVQVQEC